MRQWFKDQGTTLVEVFKDTWFSVWKRSITLAGFPILTWVSGFLDNLDFQVTELPIWPLWSRAITILFGIMAFNFLTYATKRRVATTPKMRVYFDPEDGLQIETAANHVKFRGQYIGTQKRTSKFIRLKVEAATQVRVTQCQAELALVEKCKDGKVI